MEQAEVFAGLAEAAARLEDTAAFPNLTDLTDLSLSHAASLAPDSAAVARATLAVDRVRGHRASAIEAGERCADDLDCALLLAATRQDLDALGGLIAAHPTRDGFKLVRLEVLLAVKAWDQVRTNAVRLIDRLPEEPLPQRALALATSELGDWTVSSQAASRAVALEPGWLDMAHLLGRLEHCVDGDHAAASRRLQDITESEGFDGYTDRIGVWRDLTAALLTAEDHDQAIKAARAASEIDAFDPISRLQLAWALHQKGDRTAFMAEVGEVNLGGYTGSSRARLGLSFARMLAISGLNRQALLELQGAVEADTGYTPAWVALAGVQAALGNSKMVGQALEAAALRDGNLLRTTDPLDPIWSPPVDLRPKPEQLKKLISQDMTLAAKEDALMGLLYWIRNDDRTASPLLAVAIRDGSQSGPVYSAMGQIMLAQRRYSDAIAPLSRALVLNPGQPVVTAMHSYVQGILGKRKEASVALTGLSDRLDSPPLVIWKARGLLSAGDAEAAEALLVRYLQGQSRDPVAWALLVEVRTK